MEKLTNWMYIFCVFSSCRLHSWQIIDATRFIAVRAVVEISFFLSSKRDTFPSRRNCANIDSQKEFLFAPSMCHVQDTEATTNKK